MSLPDLLPLLWAAGNSGLILGLARAVRRRAAVLHTLDTRLTHLESRMTRLEALQHEILAELRANRQALHALATRQQIADTVDRAVQAALTPRPAAPAPPSAPPSTHFHGPATVHGPLAGGNIGRLE